MLAVWPSWFQSWWTEEHEEWAPDSAFSCGEASWSWAGSWETSRKESVKEYLRKGSAGAENRMLGNKSRTMRRHSRSTARTWASPEDRRDGAPANSANSPLLRCGPQRTRAGTLEGSGVRGLSWITRRMDMRETRQVGRGCLSHARITCRIV